MGALAFSVGVAALAGAFFTGPAAAEDDDAVGVKVELLGQKAEVQVEDPTGNAEDPGDDDDKGKDDPPGGGDPCDDIPAPPICDPTTEPPPPTDDPTTNPPTDKPTKTSKPTPSNVVTRPGDGGNGGGGGNNGGSQGNSGGGAELPKTGLEIGLLAGTGAALVGGGASLMLMARRRKAAALAAEAEVSEDVERTDNDA